MPFVKKIALLICKGKKNKIYIVYFHNSRVMKHQNLLWKENLLHCSFLKTLDKYLLLYGILIMFISASVHQGFTGFLVIP